MSTLYTINVTNNSPNNQDFFFFQKPAIYMGGELVYSNSIYNQIVQPYATSGATFTLQMLQQYYAGAQTRRYPPVVGQVSGYTTATRAIDLTQPSGPGTLNCTTMTVDPSLGLGPAEFVDGVQPGAFRIVTPKFNATLNQYNAGLAVMNTQTGAAVLSNFINAEPNKNIDCQPVVIFYVQTGSYQAGTVINFTTSSVGAAACDATTGFTTFNVSYNNDGSWSVNTVSSFAGLTQLIGREGLTARAAAANTEIRNEAGTAIICTGNAVNYNPPFVVANLSNPGALALHGEYQVGPVGGHPTGRMCTALGGGSATFE
jgi:hypothetical protein